MSKKTAAQQDAERRAEARRKARMAAQGRVVEEGDGEPDAAPAQTVASMSFLQRLFPPAAPLPGKPPPLAGFAYSGRLRPLVLAAWLIRKDPYSSIGMGLLWLAATTISGQYGRSLVATIAEFTAFGALVAAGWLGWRRPWFYGFVAAMIGYLLYVPLFVSLMRGTAAGAALSTSAWAVLLVEQGLLDAGIGTLAGFYGGYLRRRLADPATRQAAANRQAAAARRRR